MSGLGDTGVLTVGSVQAGSRSNLIPDHAVLELNVRSYFKDTRERLHCCSGQRRGPRSQGGLRSVCEMRAQVCGQGPRVIRPDGLVQPCRWQDDVARRPHSGAEGQAVGGARISQ
jgi:hypothetical protein